MGIINYIRNPDKDVKQRFMIAGIAFVAAIGLSVVAPQPSEVTIYRIFVFAFVLLLIISRALTMGFWMDESCDSVYSAPGNAGNRVSHSLSIKPREHNDPSTYR